MSGLDTGWAALVRAHHACLRGVYIDRIEPVPPGPGDPAAGAPCYVSSARIPDIVSNYAVHAGWSLLPAIDRAAAAAGREPAVLSFEDPEAAGLGDRVRAVHPAAWMVRETGAPPSPPPTSDLEIRVHVGDPPPLAFVNGFGSTFESAEINRHVRDYYAAALAGSPSRAGVAARHLVGYDDGEAVCFASVYGTGSLAGLYNVATRHDRQGRGFASAISLAACAEAHRLGARGVFLQCAGGTPLEALYARLGFHRAHGPRLVELTPAPA